MPESELRSRGSGGAQVADGRQQTQRAGDAGPASGLGRNRSENRRQDQRAEGSGSPLRHETRAERSDRNWNELLQELRVTQTGVQLLTAFLLSLPFQQRFATITTGQKVVYLVTVLLAVSATGVL